MAVQTKAILVVSFGTSHNDTREKTIDQIENRIQDSFPDYRVYRAWTSDMIRKKLKNRDQVQIDSVEEAFVRMKQDGIQQVIVQPTHVMNAIENDKMRGQILAAQKDYKEIRTGDPLFATDADRDRLVEILGEYWKEIPEEELLIFMGHGTSHEANCVYEDLDLALKAAGHDNMYVGTVESLPTLHMIIEKIQSLPVKKVHLAPFMIVAGDHARNDMAGENKDSWKNVLESSGIETSCILAGLGSYAFVQQMFAVHAQQAEE